MRLPFLAEPHFIAIPALGIAYGRMPKVANSTIKRLLARAAGLSDRLTFNEVSKDLHWSDQAPDAYFLSAKALQRKFPELFVFTFVREPMERVASCYRAKVEQAKKPYKGLIREGLAPRADFADFIAHIAARPDAKSNIHYRAQSAILDGARIDFLGRYETIRDDWDDLNDMLAASGRARLPGWPKRGGKRPVVNPNDYFRGDARLIQLVKERYAEDYASYYPEFIEGEEEHIRWAL